ncbi:unnamed protein product [Adineta steineri]|uniref:Autophagy-related protein 27 n=1 Tax=Adineta steineri TaxID=433720 RepID=A0A813Z359_9BILA|nr:unnamed protein product [Adineta steineri]CAF0892777.1 unnamed protein product [Adineta steineri]
MIQLRVCVVIFTVILPFLITADNPCRFVSKEKGTIDLSSLARKDGKAAFPDETPSIGSNYIYSYNPCKPFSEGDTCKDVAVCQVSKDKTLTFVLAKQDSAKWDAGAGPGTNPIISYKFDDKEVFVELQCTDSMTAEFLALGEQPIKTYKFKLSHKCACWNGCKSSSDGLPGGAIFIIILLVLAVVYFAGFAVYNKVHHHRTGADIIPHRTFWVSLPTYAKGGVTYIISRATGKPVEKYESI